MSSLQNRSMGEGYIDFIIFMFIAYEITRSTGLAKMILHGMVQGGRRKQTEKEMGRQHTRMDRIRVEWNPSKGWGQRGMEKSGCPIILDAPKVIQTTGWVSEYDIKKILSSQPHGTSRRCLNVYGGIFNYCVSTSQSLCLCLRVYSGIFNYCVSTTQSRCLCLRVYNVIFNYCVSTTQSLCRCLSRSVQRYFQLLCINHAKSVEGCEEAESAGTPECWLPTLAGLTVNHNIPICM